MTVSYDEYGDRRVGIWRDDPPKVIEDEPSALYRGEPIYLDRIEHLQFNHGGSAFYGTIAEIHYDNGERQSFKLHDREDHKFWKDVQAHYEERHARWTTPTPAPAMPDGWGEF